ncbi:5-oxoprolinase subunit PxpB [Clostridium kluyveri]|uniref:Kinase inhibitor n=1 Tax=Clostridium kluyveri TaxID=1534 RepID=A0A1L5FAM6_CLOKL|nr:5-oxoprolinase subunit PxpB [Clostridium kluyveri]APM40066.1 kinase inhibitor [Clostridium kluyveri]UZQ49694.1 5-oxoprolinase subunit PxpB [Clostridium kluyveri]
MKQYKIKWNVFPIGESAILIEFGRKIDKDIHRTVRMFGEYLDKHPFEGMIEYVPAFSTITIFYDIMKLRTRKADKGIKKPSYEIVSSLINNMLDNFNVSIDEKVRIVKIPVCYGGKFGADLQYVAEYNKISINRVIELHSNNDYVVYMIGFAPGFPYLGGMSKEIAAPRRKSPRRSVPKGSVGIAGMQTGVYPISTPGGWQIIGNTPKVLFSPSKCPPSILRPGDVVRFYPISSDEYDKYKESEN